MSARFHDPSAHADGTDYNSTVDVTRTYLELRDPSELRGAKVVRMRRYQHHSRGRQAQQAGCADIRLGFRLVHTEELGGEWYYESDNSVSDW